VKDPKIETSEPGATALPNPDESLAKLAAFNTPPGATLGAWADSTPANPRTIPKHATL
jgi:hypothetical protein